MSLHRLDLPTLTINTAWLKYLELRDHNPCDAILALGKHFERVDEYAKARKLSGFCTYSKLDHRAKGLLK